MKEKFNWLFPPQNEGHKLRQGSYLSQHPPVPISVTVKERKLIRNQQSEQHLGQNATRKLKALLEK
jgi:hypothetical protein